MPAVIDAMPTAIAFRPVVQEAHNREWHSTRVRATTAPKGQAANDCFCPSQPVVRRNCSQVSVSGFI